MKRKVFEDRLDSEIGREFWMPMYQFDTLVDEGYDDILLITPGHRYLVALDDFLDFGYITNDGIESFYALGKSYISRV